MSATCMGKDDSACLSKISEATLHSSLLIADKTSLASPGLSSELFGSYMDIQAVERTLKGITNHFRYLHEFRCQFVVCHRLTSIPLLVLVVSESPSGP